MDACPELHHGGVSLVHIDTLGDQLPTAPLRDLGAGAFTRAIDAAVAQGPKSGGVDIGVHSLKDAPPLVLWPGVRLAACLPREDPRDALVCRQGVASLAELPRGAVVGTSSMRRKAQLLAAHPHLVVVPVRGSVEARLQLIERGELDATILACAGLNRLGLAHVASCVLSLEDMLPAACQGAVGVSCRADDSGLCWDLSLINHEPTFLEVTCERALLAQLMPHPPGEEANDSTGDSSSSDEENRDGDGGGRDDGSGAEQLPPFAVACNARFDPHTGVLQLDAMVAAPDGQRLERLVARGGVTRPLDAEEVGREAGRTLRAAAEHMQLYGV